MQKSLNSLLLLFVLLLVAVVALCCGGGQHEEPRRGRFSVSDTEQVDFAPGNLDEDGRSFVAHQWDYGWLFGWGTGDRPSDTIDDWHEYVRFDDWGSRIGGGWRTPTAQEWHYLLFERKDADQKHTVATVNGMPGLMLLPDDWVLPEGYTLVSGATSWDANSYTASQWDEMERAGAVFLPAAGFRWGAMCYSFQCQGLYWSSTIQSEGCPYTMHFDSNVLAVDWDNTPQFGQSVRLVR